jgi:hypothetical protein
MDAIEREYEYKPKWWVILFFEGYYGLAVVVLNLEAAGSPRENLPWAYWPALAVSLVMMALIGAQGLERLLCRRRVALTRTALVLPKRCWSSEEMTIDYTAITGLFLSSSGLPPRSCRTPLLGGEVTPEQRARKMRLARFLDVEYTGGGRRIDVNELPSRAALQEICELLTARVRASRQAAAAPPPSGD